MAFRFGIDTDLTVAASLLWIGWLVADRVLIANVVGDGAADGGPNIDRNRAPAVDSADAGQNPRL